MPNKIILIFVFSLLLFSCRRDDVFQVDSNTNSARDHSLAERLFGEVHSLVDLAEQGNLGNFREVTDTLYLGCATVIRDTLSNPKTILIDFGSINCTCQDGQTRRGKIIASYTGNYRDSGTVITQNLVDFFINDNEIIGSRTITNKGQNASNQTWFTIIESGSINKYAGGTILWSSNRKRTWVAGEATGNGVWQDDKYDVAGTANGTSATGITFTSLITTPLRIDLSCTQITQGKIEFSPSNRPIRYIDFGTGTCDNLANITINGNIYNVTLP